MPNPIDREVHRTYRTGLLLALIWGAVFGCGQTTHVAKPDVVTDSSNAELLTTVLDKLDPQHLGVTSEREIAVSVLNDWWKTVETDPQDVDVELPDQIANLVDSAAIKRAARQQFSGRDGSHIRTCLMFNKIAKRIANDKRYPDDATRTLALFRLVTDGVSLRLESTLPLSPFECLMSGKGTAEDRAWIFASLLRQLRIDAVILKPKSDADDQGRWLVGVLADKDVMLFDTNYGTPIPSPTDDSKSLFVTKAARLSDMKAGGDVLSDLNLMDRPYPLADADLSTLKVEVITDSTFWAPRMRRFAQKLAGQTSAMFFDGLADSADFDGLIQRVGNYAGSRWQPADVSVWKLPEERLVAFEQMQEAEQNRLKTLMAPFQSPAKYTSTNTAQGRVFQMAGYAHALFRGRLKQLLGELDDVSTLFMEVRRGEQRTGSFVPSGLGEESLTSFKSLHMSAAEDAFYWGGICSWQLDDASAAENSLRHYLDRYKRGRREESCRFWLATIVASQHTTDPRKLTEAIELLESTPTSDPQRFGNRVLANRWRRLVR